MKTCFLLSSLFTLLIHSPPSIGMTLHDDFKWPTITTGCLSEHLIQFAPFDHRPASPIEEYVPLINETISCLNEEIEFAKKNGRIFHILHHPDRPESQYIRSFVGSMYEVRDQLSDITCEERSNRHGDWIRCYSSLWKCEEIIASASTQCIGVNQ